MIYLQPLFVLEPLDLLIYNPSGFCRKSENNQGAAPHNAEALITKGSILFHTTVGTVATAAKHSGKGNDLWLRSNNDETESLPYRQAPRWIILIDYFMAC